MAKHTLSLHLSEERKTRLDALIAHSKFEGHGSQSDFLRSLIDKEAADHPEIDFEQPETSIQEEQWSYNPLTQDGILKKEQVRELLNTEQSPAIGPEHCPAAWEPRDKRVKCLLMAAHYRYYKHIEQKTDHEKNRKGSATTHKIILKDSVTAVRGVQLESKEHHEYKKETERMLDIYGKDPSNLYEHNDVYFATWFLNMKRLINRHDASMDRYGVPEEGINEHIEKGEAFIDVLRENNEFELLNDVENLLIEFKKRKNRTQSKQQE